MVDTRRTSAELLTLFADNVTGEISPQDARDLILSANISTGMIVVNQDNFATVLATIDSTKQYFIDGTVDIGATSIEVPVGGIFLRGYDFDKSKLISSEAGYTMFTSPVAGSGNILMSNMAIEVTGAGSQAFDVVSNTGFEAFEIIRINFNDCTSLGTIDNYRQGLETGTGRFGGTPTLTLKGVWVGGYRATTTIVRSLDAGMTGPLFAAGTGFLMSSRFLTDINADLGASASLVDFAPANFANPSILIFRDCIITRNGVLNANDATLTPNVSASDLVSAWIDNNGLDNTFEGGFLDTTTEAATTINTINVFETLNGVWTASDLDHFDSPAAGQLRNLSVSPRDFVFVFDGVIEGTSGNQISVRVAKYDASETTISEVTTQTREINNLSGPRDVAYFNVVRSVVLDQNDYVFLQVANTSGTDNVTLELGSTIEVLKR